MLKIFITVLLMTVSLMVISSDDKPCGKEFNIVTACDLKKGATSNVNSPRYSLFQGYVIGSFNGGAVPGNSPCTYNATDLQAIDAVKKYLSTVADCENIKASDLTAQAFSTLPKICY